MSTILFRDSSLKNNSKLILLAPDKQRVDSNGEPIEDDEESEEDMHSEGGEDEQLEDVHGEENGEEEGDEEAKPDDEPKADGDDGKSDDGNEVAAQGDAGEKEAEASDKNLISKDSAANELGKA